ncbi:MAG TPA: hypothetical protein VIF60_03135 [Burkholderiaceae bacterium]
MQDLAEEWGGGACIGVWRRMGAMLPDSLMFCVWNGCEDNIFLFTKEQPVNFDRLVDFTIGQ